jgi:hypothetical protein
MDIPVAIFIEKQPALSFPGGGGWEGISQYDLGGAGVYNLVQKPYATTHTPSKYDIYPLPRCASIYSLSLYFPTFTIILPFCKYSAVLQIFYPSAHNLTFAYTVPLCLYFTV